MKRARYNRMFTSGLFSALLVMSAGWLGLLALQENRPVASHLWIEQAYTKKLALAAATPAPRLLISAGSGAMFGLNSRMLEQALGREVINLGVNAGIQAPFVLAYTQQALRPGDWVLLPVEYPMFHDRHRINYSLIDYWLAHRELAGSRLSTVQLAQIAWSTPLERVWQGLRGLPPGFTVAGLYGPQNLDAHGDQIHSEAARQEVWMQEAVANSAVEHYGSRASAWQADWAAWKAMASRIEADGGCAIFIPPAMLDRTEYQSGVEQEYYQGLPAAAVAHGLNYIGQPLDFMYEQTEFFDTNYHLNAEARDRHTKRVISLLEPAIAAKCPH